jgi:hypothetical protein
MAALLLMVGTGVFRRKSGFDNGFTTLDILIKITKIVIVKLVSIINIVSIITTTTVNSFAQ